jgi:nitrite reductase (NO-forming)
MHGVSRARRDRRVVPTLAFAVPLGLVALVACGSGNGGGDGGASRGRPPIKGAPTIEVAGRNFAFEPAQLSVDVERFNVAFTSEDAFHTFVIEDAGGDTVVAAARGAETDRGGVELAPGRYVFYCDVPGHRAAGMEGTIAVE